VRALLAALGAGGGGESGGGGGEDEGPFWERLFDRGTLVCCGAVLGVCTATLAVLALRASASARGTARQ
jgi:hypothetical protein